MQKWIGTGRLTKDPDIRYSAGEKPCCFAKFTLAVNRRFKRENEPDADFVNCSAIGKSAEIIEKYFTKGIRWRWTAYWIVFLLCASEIV